MTNTASATSDASLWSTFELAFDGPSGGNPF